MASKPPVSAFQFKELKTAAAKVRLKPEARASLFHEHMLELERAISDNKINEYNTAIKNIKTLINEHTMKMFSSKLSQLESKVKNTRGTKFSAIIMESKMAVTGEQVVRPTPSSNPGASARTDSGDKVAGRKMNSDGVAGSSHHRIKKVGDTNVFAQEQNSEQHAKEIEYCSQEVEKLCNKLKNACKDLPLEVKTSDKKSDRKDLKDKESSLRKGIADVNEQVDRIIEHLDMTRNTTGVKGIAQEKQAQTVAEKDTKAKIGTLADLLDKLKRQVDECKYDVTFFQKLKIKDEKPEEMKKCKTCLVDICIKLKNKSDEENSLREDNQRKIKEFEKQVELIKKIWVEGCEKQEKESPDSISILTQLKNHMSENRKAIDELKKNQEIIKAEIGLLREDISHFDDGTEPSIEKTSKTQPEILQAIRNARKQLNDRKKEVANAMKNRSTDKKQENTKLRKHVANLWKVAFGTDKDVTNAEGANGRIQDELQMLNEIIPEFENLEKISFALEEVSYDIQRHVIGVQLSKKDTMEFGTPMGVLENTLEILRSCCKETNVFADNFSELCKAMSVECTNTTKTLSRRCSVMTEAATRWEKDSQDMKCILEKCQKFLPLAYTELIAEPYFFEEPHINSGSIKERFPAWLQEVAHSISQIRGCIKTNKDSFRKRFTETDVVFQCLFQLYADITKEDYKWEKSKPGKQRDEEKSLPGLHVTSVIEDICKRISKSSADSVERKYQKDINRLKEEHTQLEQERQSLLTRLSKLAGANLTDNNPNIADLSDPHRPTKLADDYSELYDNEWTTAFEEFEKQGKPEKDILKLLLGIISETYSVCGDIGRKQNSVIRSGLLSPADLVMSNVDDGSKTAKKSARSSGKPKGEPMKPNEESLAAVHSKTISELRKQTAKSSVSSIIEYFKAQPQFSEWFKTNDVEVYTVRCIKLCWLMNVQYPPVYMERDLKAGTSFETAKYKPYTKAGKKIAFVVWPALFLHDGGALLAKGVAQGK